MALGDTFALAIGLTAGLFFGINLGVVVMCLFQMAGRHDQDLSGRPYLLATADALLSGDASCKER